MAAEEDPEFDDAIDALAQLFIEGAEPQYRSQLEPFDVYTQKVRHQFHQTLSGFRARFAHGYEVLIKKVKDQNAMTQIKKPGVDPWIRV